MANKLELTWFGKDEPMHIEPRLLIENTELSNTGADPDTENILIHGDNLLALKALESKYAGQVKCIYIDPPYNTGAAFEHYDDNLEHSIWLDLMSSRLEILKNLLSEDGLIFIQIDDNEQAYLKVLCDEIFGRKNYLNTITIKAKAGAGASGGGEDKKLKKNCEYILIYVKNYDKVIRIVKPFMLVVCKDTEHASWVESFIKSDEFREGAYRNKTITVHSKQKGAESEANTRLLLDVESEDNPVEIVIHVNMLKEGWDVNNLYTIVPLRTAASKILREQMVGRGLRLPYGERTGDKDVDAVMLTAHDKFNDILAEAQKGDSIFKAGNVIKAEEIVPEKITSTQLKIEFEPDKVLETAYSQTNIEKSEEMDTLVKKATEIITTEVSKHIQNTPTHKVDSAQAKEIVSTVAEQLGEDKDLGKIFKENEMPLAAWLLYQTEETHKAAQEKFIPIPRIKVTDSGVEEYVFVDFDLELFDFTHVPIKNELLVQNLEDMQDKQRIKGEAIDFEGYNPKKVILEQLRQKPEIDYEKCSALLFKLITKLCDHYEGIHGENGMRNIVMMYKRDIGNKIYKQMMQHFYCENGFLQEEVIGTRDYNLQQTYSYKEKVSLFDSFSEDIRSVLFCDIKRGVFENAKFDSLPELVLARVLETETNDVENWLRPSPREFNITYNHGHTYEPDFVVETKDTIYLVEVKGEDKLQDPDVIAKKKRGVQYCEVASRWGKANGYKEWKYLFIPSKQIMPNSSFVQLAKRFQE